MYETALEFRTEGNNNKRKCKQRIRLNKSSIHIYIYNVIICTNISLLSFVNISILIYSSAQEYNYQVISTPISLRMTLFKTRAGTMLTKETLVCTRNERNFVQLSNVQAVFSANAARKSRLLRCFSPTANAPLPFPPLQMEFFGTSALKVHL